MCGCVLESYCPPESGMNSLPSGTLVLAEFSLRESPGAEESTHLLLF